jgi:short-subunit dehydrogenase
MYNEFKQKQALVLGGSSGIGQAIAKSQNQNDSTARNFKSAYRMAYSFSVTAIRARPVL